MKKIVRISEDQLVDIIKKMIMEQPDSKMPFQPEKLGYNPKDPNSIKIYMENLNKVLSPIKINRPNLPLHIRAFYDYLTGRTQKMTENELTNNEKILLKKIAINAKKNNKGFTYGMWKNIGAKGLPTAMTSRGAEINKETNKDGSFTDKIIKYINVPMAGQFMYTFGEIAPENISVTPDKKNVKIFDNYDMNSFNNNFDKIINDFVVSVKNYVEDKVDLYSVIRNAASLRELTGYKGYNIYLNL